VEEKEDWRRRKKTGEEEKKTGEEERRPATEKKANRLWREEGRPGGISWPPPTDRTPADKDRNAQAGVARCVALKFRCSFDRAVGRRVSLRGSWERVVGVPSEVRRARCRTGRFSYRGGSARCCCRHLVTPSRHGFEQG
jgi:hypothetical protein